jgi:hypothetical protein
MTEDPLPVPCSCKLELEFSGSDEARRVAASLEPDNDGFLVTTLKGRKLIVNAKAGSIPALLHTLDDYLACLGVAAGIRKSLEDE